MMTVRVAFQQIWFELSITSPGSTLFSWPLTWGCQIGSFIHGSPSCQIAAGRLSSEVHTVHPLNPHVDFLMELHLASVECFN